MDAGTKPGTKTGTRMVAAESGFTEKRVTTEFGAGAGAEAGAISTVGASIGAGAGAEAITGAEAGDGAGA